MEKLIMCLLSLLTVTSISAQVKQGVIVYERKVNLHTNIPKEDERVKNIIPEFSTSKVKLVFSGEESVASNLTVEPDIIESTVEDDNTRFKIRLKQPEVETYKNYKIGKSIELRELGPRKYIIEEDLPVQKWQLREETKIIHGYNCKKAVARNQEGKEVVAWYTEEIPCPSGPELWGGLPGAILHMDIDDAQVSYSAVSIDSQAGNQLVKSPSGGKKISKAAFEKMMRDMSGPEEGGGRIIIRRLEQ